MLVQHVLYTVDAEACPLSVWEQHVSVTALALAMTTTRSVRRASDFVQTP
jgi:hypothetical protein